MKKRILLGLTVAILVTALTGCEWLLAPRVDKVNPADLKSYSAGSEFSEDEASVQNAMAVTGEGAGGGPGYIFDTEVTPPGYSVQDPSFKGVFNGLVQHSIDAARSMAPSRSVDVTDDSDFSDPSDFEIDYTVDISNESVNGADVYTTPTGGGTATIETFLLEITGSGSETSSSAEFDANGKQEGVFTYDEWTDNEWFIIHDGRVNSEGSGRVSLEVNETSTDISGNLFWRFGYAVNAGFSVTDLKGTTTTGDDEGGKIIVSFRYWGRENIDFDSSTELSNQAQGEFEAEMTVEVYDNDNSLIAEYEYTDEDVYDSTGSL